MVEACCICSWKENILIFLNIHAYYILLHLTEWFLLHIPDSSHTNWNCLWIHAYELKTEDTLWKILTKDVTFLTNNVPTALLKFSKQTYIEQF